MFSVAGTTDAKYEVKTISVNITPPFWQTIWFKCLVVLILIAITLATARYIYQYKLRKRIRELEKEKALEEERKRISREMHDDIGAGLTRITLMSELAKHSAANKEKLEEIANASRQLVSNMSEIIWSLNPEHRSLNQLLSYLREDLVKLIEPSGIDFTIEFPEEAKELLLSNEQKRNILLVTKEVVHNAVKHSKARSISIKAKVKEDNLRITIIDDGVGFDIDQVSNGNGLKNLQHRFTELEAQFAINTAPGKGVITSFSIPLKSHF
jgi:signal transduction histidine kinase